MYPPSSIVLLIDLNGTVRQVWAQVAIALLPQCLYQNNVPFVAFLPCEDTVTGACLFVVQTRTGNNSREVSTPLRYWLCKFR